MPGFQLVEETEIEQGAKYRARLEIKAEMRRAIVEGAAHCEKKGDDG